MERWRDDAPEEDEDDLEEGVWELDPNDPSHPDYDLSESAGYASWEPAPKPVLLRRGVVLALTLAVVVALVLPFLTRIF
jgi:hypothetical protein